MAALLLIITQFGIVYAFKSLSVFSLDENELRAHASVKVDELGDTFHTTVIQMKTKKGRLERTMFTL
jgi:ribosome-associated toxin RatA of RatAB toxin-antitoxin module